jgi:hypothetical protein
MSFTVIVCYYRQPAMLQRQLDNWKRYSAAARKRFTLLVVDDGSPEPASNVVTLDDGVQLYRVTEDIPWHRNPCRNLGASLCETEWLIQLDIDHVLPPASADALLKFKPERRHWYRFPRWRVGRADETRKKDARKHGLPDDCEFGRIGEHIDSYLMTRDMFLRSPYDESYQGFLGGGSPFLKRMETLAPVKVLPSEVCLHVYTRHAVPDASVTTLSRDTSQYSKVRKDKERRGDTVPKMVLDFEWSRVF